MTAFCEFLYHIIGKWLFSWKLFPKKRNGLLNLIWFQCVGRKAPWHHGKRVRFKCRVSGNGQDYILKIPTNKTKVQKYKIHEDKLRLHDGKRWLVVSSAEFLVARISFSSYIIKVHREGKIISVLKWKYLSLRRHTSYIFLVFCN